MGRVISLLYNVTALCPCTRWFTVTAVIVVVGIIVIIIIVVVIVVRGGVDHVLLLDSYHL